MSTSVDVLGPLFLSYRHNDGAEIVANLAWLLRAAGIPVWRDKDDLPPGDTAERLAEAIGDGLSGAVFVITEDIANSAIVRGIEAPKLIDLHRSDARFQLLIANDVAKESSASLDYSAPDRLLGRVKDDLKGVDQSGTSPEGLLSLVGKAVAHRMAQHRPLVENNGRFDLSIQTRNIGQVYDRTGAQLDIRVRRSSHETLPDSAGLEDLRRSLTLLPDAITRTGARAVRITGGAHLSIAFALGIALPSARIGHLEVVDQRDAIWASGEEAAVPSAPTLQFTATKSEEPAPQGTRPTVAVYVDLLPTQSDAAFDRYLAEHGEELDAYAVIRLHERGLIDPARAGAIASEVAGLIRQLSATYGNAQVDLLLALPFGLAVLIGRLCNTLRLRVFEWDNSDDEASSDARPRYVPCVAVRANSSSGPITAVLLEACTA
ncbi:MULTISPECIES: SAVED domain-containing protein [unclassified Microbacterium]|uniref:SAVED domain-containing protein n=1 Tax=unclassified Microbacterium TaxID=2609290 RepID=UPI0004932129|nr:MULTISPECIES: SAVED domain-containing protein [unclassified Microbacterium]